MINLKRKVFSRWSSVAALSILLLSFNGYSSNGFDYQVSGVIRGLKNDSLIVFIRNYDNPEKVKIDTVITVAKDDAFSFKGKNDRIRDAYVIVGGFRARKNFTFFIEKGSIHIDGDVSDVDNISVTGTPGNEDYTIQKKIENDIYGKMKQLQARYKEQQGNKDEAAKIMNEMDACRDSIQVKRIQFITSKPGSPASAIFLYVLQDHISVEELETLYNNLSDAVKKVSFVRDIPNKIAARKRSSIGKSAPEFAAMDINGKSFKLSDYRGKYVLLEFWASWCVPCRQETPAVVKAYAKFHDKGLEIISVSLDDKKDKWEKAIEEDHMPWTHTSDLNAFDNKIAKLYGVQPIPDNFLIDPQGKIVARALRGEELEEKLGKEIHQ
jgi:peroxiredoxin